MIKDRADRKKVNGLHGANGFHGVYGADGLNGRHGLFLFIWSLSFITISCSSESLQPDNKTQRETDTLEVTDTLKQAIGFTARFAESVSVGKRQAAMRKERAATRAAGDGELTTEELKAKGFGVYCWYTGSTSIAFTDAKGTTPEAPISTYAQYMLMNNQKVEWKAWDGVTDTWNYTPAKYWPLEPAEMLTFRAYAPYTDYLITDAKGMPQLPVVVDANDYKNGTQHDPLWGTGATTITHKIDPYIPDDIPDDYPDGTKYGPLYNNITYQMSGDAAGKDAHDGTIHWFFHHGMSQIMFTCSITQDPGCDLVTIKNITITPLYTQGLLDISSPTASSSEKPIWTEPGGSMTVELTPTELANNPFDITPLTDRATDPIDLLPQGLLIIPRDYRLSEMTVSITYTIDGEDGDPLTAVGHIQTNFEGNTTYTLGLSLTPETKGLEIDVVQSAFTPWISGGTGEHPVYNW